MKTAAKRSGAKKKGDKKMQRTPAKKTAPQKQKKSRKEAKEDIIYAEVKVNCTECGKECRVVVLEGTDMSEYLCQKCSTGDFLDEDDDFG